MKKVIRLTESDLIRIVRRVINEQEVGGFKEGPGDPQTDELEHYNKIVKPKLLKSGFKDEYDKKLKQIGTENSLSYGGHSNGVNVLLDKMKGIYYVWVGNNKGMKEFLLGPNDPKVVANKVVQYALSLKR
jgi:hypothetical protein